MRVSIGMGRKSPHNAYFDNELTEHILKVADKAEQFFDSLYVSGSSRIEKTKTGKPKTVTLNLLSQRLHIGRDLPGNPAGGDVRQTRAAYQALISARRRLDESGALQEAAELRLTLDHQQQHQ